MINLRKFSPAGQGVLLDVGIAWSGMSPALVPPSGPVTRKSIPAGTKPGSLWQKIRMALFDMGVGRGGGLSRCL